MTGRGLGFCAGFDRPGFGGFGGGGFAYARGWRRGNRNMYYATGLPGWARGRWGAYSGRMTEVPNGGRIRYSRSEEITYLKDQAGYFREMLDQINRRIDELGKLSTREEEKR
jgi:hypothetical protein